MRSRHDVDREGLAVLLEGEPRYRVDQVWHGLHDQGLAPEAITTLPRAVRARHGV